MREVQKLNGEEFLLFYSFFKLPSVLSSFSAGMGGSSCCNTNCQNQWKLSLLKQLKFIMCLEASLLRSNLESHVATIEGLLYKMYYSLSCSFKLAVLNIPKHLPKPLFINMSLFCPLFSLLLLCCSFPSLGIFFLISLLHFFFFISLLQECSVLDFWFLHVSSFLAFVRLLISLVYNLSHLHKKQCAMG